MIFLQTLEGSCDAEDPEPSKVHGAMGI